MNAFLLLLLIIACSIAAGLVLGRYLFPLTPPLPAPPVRYNIGDHAFARILHEAARAYRQTLGVFNLRSWNNLTEDQRLDLVEQVARFRAGASTISLGARNSFEIALYVAIARLASRSGMQRDHGLIRPV